MCCLIVSWTWTKFISIVSNIISCPEKKWKFRWKKFVGCFVWLTKLSVSLMFTDKIQCTLCCVTFWISARRRILWWSGFWDVTYKYRVSMNISKLIIGLYELNNNHSSRIIECICGNPRKIFKYWALLKYQFFLRQFYKNWQCCPWIRDCPFCTLEIVAQNF